MTISVNYVGDQSHFLNPSGQNARGYWSNQLNPIYLAGLGGVTDSTGTKPILIAAATSANVAKAQAAMSSLNIPTFFQNAANANPNSSVLTITQGLTGFPQYSGVTDLWGANSASLTYHSFQLMLLQRTAHGLSFNINYTFSKNIGDDGTFPQRVRHPGCGDLGQRAELASGPDRTVVEHCLGSSDSACLRGLPASIRQEPDRRQLHAGALACMDHLRDLYLRFRHTARRDLQHMQFHQLSATGSVHAGRGAWRT